MAVAIAGAKGRQPQGSALRLLSLKSPAASTRCGNYGAAAPPIILDMRYAVALGSQVIFMPGGDPTDLQSIANLVLARLGRQPVRTLPDGRLVGCIGVDSMATNASRSAPPPASPSERAHSGAELSPRSADSRSRGADRFDPAISVDLPLALPVTDAEVRLVAAYLGDLIHQILSEHQ